MRNPLSAPVLENRPPNIKCIVPAFFGDRFGGKDGGLCTYPPAKEVGLLGYFCMQWLKTLNSNKKFKIKIRNQKPIAFDVLSFKGTVA